MLGGVLPGGLDTQPLRGKWKSLRQTVYVPRGPSVSPGVTAQPFRGEAVQKAPQSKDGVWAAQEAGKSGGFQAGSPCEQRGDDGVEEAARSRQSRKNRRGGGGDLLEWPWAAAWGRGPRGPCRVGSIPRAPLGTRRVPAFLRDLSSVGVCSVSWVPRGAPPASGLSSDRGRGVCRRGGHRNISRRSRGRR